MQDGDRDLFRLLEPVVRSQGLDPVEIRLVGGDVRPIVRIVLHSPDGVSHADCARVTRAASTAVEEAGTIPGRYVLEVSSAGMERVLKDPREFDVFRGLRIWVRMAEGDPPEIVGTAVGLQDDGSVVVRTDDGSESRIDWARVRKARLVPEKPAPRDGGES